MNSCVLTFEDFKRVFDFSVNYHLNCASLADRTNGNPRNLGGIMDAFSIGKLIEIGVEKIFFDANSSKKYILDFSIHQANNDADIIKIEENGKIRDVKNYVEIKSLSKKDEWIGIREEQFTSIKMYSKNKGITLNNIFLVYAELKTKEENRKNDITSIFLKKIEDKNKSVIFEKYAELDCEVKIEFIISFEELEKYGRMFRKDIECIYDTNILQEVKRNTIYKNEKLRNNFEYIDNNINNLKLYTTTGDCLTQNELTKFKIINKDEKIDFKIIKKINRNSNKFFIETSSNINLYNNIFGSFQLKQYKIYSLNLNTKGRKPILKNNNLFISRKMIYELIQNKKIKNINERINEIVLKI